MVNRYPNKSVKMEESPLLYIVYVVLVDGYSFAVKVTRESVREKMVGTVWHHPHYEHPTSNVMLFKDEEWKDEDTEKKFNYIIGDVDLSYVDYIYYRFCVHHIMMPSEWKEGC